MDSESSNGMALSFASSSNGGAPATNWNHHHPHRRRTSSAKNAPDSGEDDSGPTKRPRLQDPVTAEGDEMDLDAPEIARSLSSYGNSQPFASTFAPDNDPDRVLVEMVRSGLASSSRCSHAEVVDFCRSAGIPLSRMLQLDLLGLVRHTGAGASSEQHR